MGNRCVITTRQDFNIPNGMGLGLYLHWNGGRDSVSKFLQYCRMRGFRGLPDPYGYARLSQVIGNYIGGTLSLGVGLLRDIGDGEDNGTYIISNDWRIVGREYFDGVEQKKCTTTPTLYDIDSCQPEDDRLGSDYIKAKWKKVEDIKVGDKVFIYLPHYNKPEIWEVVGYTEYSAFDKKNRYLGEKTYPCIDKYPNHTTINVNNILRSEKYKVLK